MQRDAEPPRRGVRGAREPYPRAVESEPSADQQRRRIEALEARMASAPASVYEVGYAMGVIRGERLYRVHGYVTFGEYVRHRWGSSRAYAYRKIDAARVIEVLRAAGLSELPSNEAQTRELAPFMRRPDALVAIWIEAVGRGGGPVTAAAVRRVAAGHRRAGS